ncbi:hypothetical protein BGW41_003391 [Actinomortierella wolfii]|nr:hypothetical protein BGW41_003391 [Actinomortierella wolfii]
MSFNLGSNDRNPSFGNKPPGGGRNPLAGAIHSAEHNQGGDMILTKDHPGWSGGDASGDAHQGSSSGSSSDAQAQASSRDMGSDMPQRPPAAVHAGAASFGGYDRRPDSELPSQAIPRGSRFDTIVPGEVRPANARGNKTSTPQLSGEPDYDDMLPPGCNF